MNNLSNFKNLLIQKKQLILCIFTTLIFQSIITIFVFNKIKTNPEKFKWGNLNSLPKIILLIILNIFLIFVMVAFDINFYLKFIIFIIFSIIQGFFLGEALKYIDQGIINSVLFSTLSIFVILLLFGLLIVYLKIDITRLGFILFICLLLLIISQITAIFIHESKTLNRILTIFGLLIFSLYILYDTNHILLKYRNGTVDCIKGALDYYLDLINIFLDLVNLKS